MVLILFFCLLSELHLNEDSEAFTITAMEKYKDISLHVTGS